MLSDVRFALRGLARSPLFAAVALASLALGIGANTAVFSLLDQVLLRMLPVAAPERLAVLHQNGRELSGWSTADNRETVFSYPMYRDLCARQRMFAGLIARAGAAVAVLYNGETERESADLVSGNYFEVLGVKPVLGRLLSSDDDVQTGGHPVVVLSHGYWLRRFGANPALLNQTVRINGHAMTVIGVAPRGFTGLIGGQAAAVYIPIAMKREVTPTWNGLDDRTIHWVNVLGRLKDGQDMRGAEAGLAAVYRPLLEDELEKVGRSQVRYPDRYLAQRIELRPASQGINTLGSMWRQPLLVLAGMAGLVLLISCANVAGLLVARAAGRGRELAVRMALGAGSMRIARQLIIESVLLALAGGFLGLVVAIWSTRGLVRLLDVTDVLSARPDERLLLFNLVLSALAGLLFGLVPAIRASRTEIAPVLKDEAAGAAGHGSDTRLRKLIVAGQVALATMLLVLAGLFARTLDNLRTVDMGFQPDRLWSFSVDPRLAGYSRERGFEFYRELQARLARLPGALSVGAANLPPLAGGSRGGNLTVEGWRGSEGARSAMNPVGPDYFRTLGIPLIAGREFTDRDSTAAPKTVVVNQAFARHYFGTANPIGKRVAFGAGSRIGLDREIAGVVGNSKHSNLRETPDLVLYFPYTQDERLDRMTFYLRTRSPLAVSEVRSLVRQMDANVPVFQLASMREQIDRSIRTERLIAGLAGAFGILASFLGCVGLYGVIAYTVARRTSEIGIRVALGASPRRVLAMVMGEVAALGGAGLVCGVGLSLALGRTVESQLYGIRSADPPVIAAAALCLACVTAAAGYLPARRAANLDAMKALRRE